MKKLKVIVQGEVIIREVKELPEELPGENQAGVAAYGETGNAHAFVGGKFKLYGDILATQKYLKVLETTELRHGTDENSQGHEIAIIEPGVYEIYPQNEVDIIEKRSRTVLD